MDKSTLIYLLLGTGTFIFIAFVGKRAGWFQLISGTNKLLREQNQELKNTNQLLRDQISTNKEEHDRERKDWSDKYHKSQEQIAELKGKIDQTINIPLVNISKSLEQLSDTNSKILEKLSPDLNTPATPQAPTNITINKT
jgi:hypothetical protein